jgi:hypothetical protein
MINCIDEEKTKFHIVGEVIEDTMKKLETEYLEKLKGGKGKMAWVKYDEEMKQKCLDLLKQGKKVREVVRMVNGPKSKAIMRWARKSGISYKC